MYFEEYGKKENPTVIMLHGAFFTDTYSRQYALGDRFHLVIPHIRGFGKAANETFDADGVTSDFKELSEKYAPCFLVGFSLGAQLAFRLVAERPNLFKKAVIVSPWLINKSEIPDDMMSGNLKMLSRLKSKFVCRMIALSSGMPRQKAAEFVDSMQNVSEQTVRNCVDNKISFDTVKAFSDCGVPILALAGEKEPEDIRKSVEKMAEINKNCTVGIWKKAKHNIPMAYSEKFNSELESFFK